MDTFVSQLLNSLGSSIGPLAGVIVGGIITYKAQTSISKQNEIKAIYAKLFGLKILIKQLYINRLHLEARRIYFLNIPKFQEFIRPSKYKKKIDTVETRSHSLDIKIAHTESKIAETCGSALIYANKEDDKAKINNLLNHPKLKNIEATFVTLGKDVKNINELDVWLQDRKEEIIEKVEEEINKCFSPVEMLEIFKLKS